MARIPAVAFLLLAAVLSGCVGDLDDYHTFDADAQYRNPGVFEGSYVFTRDGSTVLSTGALSATQPEVVRLRSTLPAYAAMAGESSTDAEVTITMAIWRPENVTTPVPIIVDAGPYFEYDSHCRVPDQNPCRVEQIPDAIDYPGQTTPFSLKNFLPHGYAVVQLAVRGTGTSGGCMDLLGPAEQHDLDQAITWLGEQPWSNGNIAMVGASYDGSTPWLVAAAGNPHLKTIVPTSGLPDIFDLMFRNGTAETRGSIMHSLVYWPYGFSDGFPWNRLPAAVPPGTLPPFPGAGANGREQYQDLQNLVCPELYRGAAQGPLASVTGSRLTEASDYWTVRDHQQAVLDNYEGSIFLVHGLQDWNVDPHVAVPFNVQLRAAGIEMKEWFGQWGHAFPDSTCARTVPDWVTLPCRLDFAEVLLRWFDRYLKDNATADLGPALQVQDNVGFWRNADAFPPTDAAWQPWALTGDGALSNAAGPASTFTLNPPQTGAPGNTLELKSAVFEEDVRVSGLPTLHIPFTSTAGGGMLGAWLMDEDADGNVRAPSAGQNLDGDWVPFGIPVVGHAQMNLRYYAGGEEAQTLRPDTQYVARMQFEPLDILVPRGHRLTLWVFQYAYPDHQASLTPSPVEIALGEGGAVLNLPTIAVDARTVFPVPGAHFPSRDLVGLMFVPKPALTASSPLPIPVPPACSGLPQTFCDQHL
ncbi:MAG: CocE/NonD family hydrolase [Candidatus Thermoplasmatota archaeon]